ncbi:hypothetical protein ACFQH2_03350 [Natronoarchaeum sp. GCM10025703]
MYRTYPRGDLEDVKAPPETIRLDDVVTAVSQIGLDRETITPYRATA